MIQKRIQKRYNTELWEYKFKNSWKVVQMTTEWKRLTDIVQIAFQTIYFGRIKFCPFLRFLLISLKFMRPNEPICVTFRVSYYVLENIKFLKAIPLWKTTRKNFKTGYGWRFCKTGSSSFTIFQKKNLICYLFNSSLFSLSDYKDKLNKVILFI